MHNHAHDHGAILSEEARAILREGITELLRLTKGKKFRPIASERYPLPLALAVYGEVPEPERVRREVRDGMQDDLVRVLEPSLVSLELYASNQPAVCKLTPDDDAFLTEIFGSKRMNGWIVLLGDSNPHEIQATVNARWQFKFVDAGEKCASLYVLLNVLARYAFVYGRVPLGDTHLLGHFIEDFTSG